MHGTGISQWQVAVAQGELLLVFSKELNMHACLDAPFKSIFSTAWIHLSEILPTESWDCIDSPGSFLRQNLILIYILWNMILPCWDRKNSYWNQWKFCLPPWLPDWSLEMLCIIQESRIVFIFHVHISQQQPNKWIVTWLLFSDLPWEANLPILRFFGTLGPPTILLFSSPVWSWREIVGRDWPETPGTGSSYRNSQDCGHSGLWLFASVLPYSVFSPRFHPTLLPLIIFPQPPVLLSSSSYVFPPFAILLFN